MMYFADKTHGFAEMLELAMNKSKKTGKTMFVITEGGTMVTDDNRGYTHLTTLVIRNGKMSEVLNGKE